MVDGSVTSSIEQLTDGVLRVAFTGHGGLGSDGNPDGERMREAIGEAIAGFAPKALVVDLTGFEYRFGDWIAVAAITALKSLGQGRVCILATGETAAAICSLWEVTRLGSLIPLFSDPSDALLYLSGHRG